MERTHIPVPGGLVHDTVANGQWRPAANGEVIHPQVVNHKELRVVGMSRSGNHAIIHWILRQAKGRYCFLNCAEGKTNPFTSARLLHHDLPYEVNYPEFDYARELAGDLSAKALLVHSYEDGFLGHVCHARFEKHHDRWVGATGQRFDVLILRDPFNLFASRLRAGVGEISTAVAVRMWKQHAREFLGRRRMLTQPRILVNYNRWATERPYRQQLAAQLGLCFTDAGIDDVHRTAGGSSFDGARYDGRAAQMRVLERWKFYRDDPAYWRIFNREMVELSVEIFGPLAGAAHLPSVAAGMPAEAAFSPVRRDVDAPPHRPAHAGGLLPAPL